jgi:hypothetical protein
MGNQAMKISRAALAVAAVLSFAAAAAPASATIVTYDWTLTSTSTVPNGGINGSGTLTVDTSQTTSVQSATNPSVFYVGDLITGITGNMNGGGSNQESIAINGLAPVGASPQNNDNLLFVSGHPELLDLKGFAFTSAATGSTTYDLLSSLALGSTTTPGSNPYQLIGPGGEFGSLGVGTFTITPVPLPASLCMLVIGLAGLGFAAVRQSRQQGGASLFRT